MVTLQSSELADQMALQLLQIFSAIRPYARKGEYVVNEIQEVYYRVFV